MENPVVTHLKKKQKSMRNFLHFIGVNAKRNGAKVSIKFRHRKFREDEGFATMDFQGIEMDKIIRRIEQVVEEELQSINGTIESYEKNKQREDSGDNTVGSMD